MDVKQLNCQLELNVSFMSYCGCSYEINMLETFESLILASNKYRYLFSFSVSEEEIAKRGSK